MYAHLWASSRVHAYPRAKTGVYAILGAQSGMHTARTLGSWLLAGTLLEKFVCLCPTSGYLVWGTLDPDTLQKLIHQSCLLCKGARQLYDLSRQVLFTIWIGKAWNECASLGSGRVVDSVREI
ncbi:hypothetical protein ACFX13_030056 [Malus domestica]